MKIPSMPDRNFPVVTGVSSGIGFELASECAEHSFYLLIAANEPEINNVAEALRRNIRIKHMATSSNS
jgi:short-subunit dehydrogenase